MIMITFDDIYYVWDYKYNNIMHNINGKVQIGNDSQEIEIKTGLFGISLQGRRVIFSK